MHSFKPHCIIQNNLFNQVRGIRTKSPIKLNLKNRIKDANVTNNEKVQQESTNVIQHEGNKDLSKTRFSKFSRNGRNKNVSKDSDGEIPINKIIHEMQFKKPQEIMDELTARFKKDGIDVDPEFIEKMVEQSNKEQEQVATYIKDPSMTLSRVSEDEINKYVDWLIADGRDRIGAQQRDSFNRKYQLRNKLDEFLANEDPDSRDDPESLTKAFSVAQELSILNSESALDKLPLFLKHINKMNNLELQACITLEKCAALYEISTQLLDSHNRQICIYLSGKLLYHALNKELGPRARPDPINEKFFIESCINANDLDRAQYLYETRKEKDVKDERFWFELGVSIHMAKYSNTVKPNIDDPNNEETECDDLNKAMDLTHDIRDRWGYVNNITLIDALKRCCVKGYFDDAFWFWEDIELNVDELGIVKNIVVPETKLYDDKDRDQVFDYYNRVEPISYDVLIECIFAFIGGLQIEKGFTILAKIVDVDDEFIYEFVKRFGVQFGYFSRECFLIELEKDSSLKQEDQKYTPFIRDYLIEEIKALQKTRCHSFEEAKLLEDVNVYLGRLTQFKTKDLPKINDLQEIIQSGEKLTSFDVKNILSVLLQHKSTTSFTLACRMIYQMNEHKLNKELNAFLPVANSYAYTEFLKQFLVQPNPRVKEINHFLTMMADYGVNLDPKLANNIIFSFVSKKLYSEAINFIGTYLFTNNPIAITSIPISHPGKKNLWTTTFMAYYKSVVSGLLSEEVFKTRLESLRVLIKHLMDENVDDEYTIKEAIGVLLAYGDFQSAICLVQHYGRHLEQLQQPIGIDFVLALKAKFEVSISKAEKYLLKSAKTSSCSNSNFEVQIKNYRQNFGLQSLQQDLKIKKVFSWQEVAIILYKYAELFSYRSTYAKEDPFSMLLPDSVRNNNKTEFDKTLRELQEFYDLPIWKPQGS